MKNNRTYLFSISLTICIFLGACSTTSKMLVPADITKTTEVIEATNRSSWSGALANESFTLGPYQVSDVDRKWDYRVSDSLSIAFVSFSSAHTDGGYTYVFDTPEGKLNGKCLTELRGSDVNVGSAGSLLAQVKKYSCVCERENIELASVFLETSERNRYQGILKAGGESYVVDSIYKRKGSFSDGAPSGYRIDGDSVIGAVEAQSIYPGRIWLAKNLSRAQKASLSCTFAGLMLYMPPNSDYN